MLLAVFFVEIETFNLFEDFVEEIWKLKETILNFSKIHSDIFFSYSLLLNLIAQFLNSNCGFIWLLFKLFVGEKMVQCWERM